MYTGCVVIENISSNNMVSEAINSEISFFYSKKSHSLNVRTHSLFLLTFHYIFLEIFSFSFLIQKKHSLSERKIKILLSKYYCFQAIKMDVNYNVYDNKNALIKKHVPERNFQSFKNTLFDGAILIVFY